MEEEEMGTPSGAEEMGGSCAGEMICERIGSYLVSVDGQGPGDRKNGPSRHQSGAAAFLTLSLLGVLSVIPDSGSYYALRGRQEEWAYTAPCAVEEQERTFVLGRSTPWSLASERMASGRPACQVNVAAEGMEAGGNQTMGYMVLSEGGFVTWDMVRHSWGPQAGEEEVVEGSVLDARPAINRVTSGRSLQDMEYEVWGMVESSSDSETDIQVIVPDAESDGLSSGPPDHGKSGGRRGEKEGVECTLRLLVDACELESQGEQWMRELREKLNDPKVKTIYLEDPVVVDSNRRTHQGRLGIVV